MLQKMFSWLKWNWLLNVLAGGVIGHTAGTTIQQLTGIGQQVAGALVQGMADHGGSNVATAIQICTVAAGLLLGHAATTDNTTMTAAAASTNQGLPDQPKTN
jgi:hypothetical protein